MRSLLVKRILKILLAIEMLKILNLYAYSYQKGIHIKEIKPDVCLF